MSGPKWTPAQQAAIGLRGENGLYGAGHCQRVRDAGEEREEAEQDGCGTELGEHDATFQLTPAAERARGVNGLIGALIRDGATEKGE